MRFWDASAVVPLILNQPTSVAVAPLLAQDRMLVVWWATRVECASAIARLLREGALSVQEVNRARVSLAELYGSLREVEPSDAVREAAERILSVHPLRVADALQLAAALHWCDDDPAGRQFACLDRRLREAAESEGFSIVP